MIGVGEIDERRPYIYVKQRAGRTLTDGYNVLIPGLFLALLLQNDAERLWCILYLAPLKEEELYTGP